MFFNILDAEPSKDLGLIVGITVPGIALAILLLIAIVIIAVVVNIKKSKLRSNKVYIKHVVMND